MPMYTDELVVTVANLYYLEDLTQEEVADRLSLSRVAVTRILKRARDDGLVQVTVKRPLPELFALGLELERAFGLRAARVVATGSTQEDTLDNIGRAGAELLGRFALPGKRVGAAWSRTVSAVVPYVRKPPKPPLCVNELAGTYLEPGVPYGVSWKLAEKLGAPLETIPAPVLVRSAEAKALMLEERSVARAFENAERVDVAFVGIGGVGADASVVKTGYVSEVELREIGEKGAVGDILMRYFDAEGKHVRMSFEDRAVSLDWKPLRRLPMVIGMAFGPAKLAAMRGAIAGRLVQGLVTDRATAEALLAASRGTG
jgi:DNA-binding transcriptional regulator LsrR (DeoR family)